jgi:hypothetical protein
MVERVGESPANLERDSFPTVGLGAPKSDELLENRNSIMSQYLSFNRFKLNMVHQRNGDFLWHQGGAFAVIGITRRSRREVVHGSGGEEHFASVCLVYEFVSEESRQK